MVRYAARLASTLFVLLLGRDALAREPPSVHDDERDLEVEDDLGARGQLRTRAESVSFDAKERSLELSGDVHLDAPPFHLRSEHITLSRTRWGIEAKGKGRLAFCPCLGTPLTIEFDEAIVAPPGELLLKAPKLEVYGVPVLFLPWFWLRSDEKIGVLPPDVAYRGQDGLFLGEGVHVPWKDRGERRALDLRGGVYLRGGYAAGARLTSPSSTAHVRYDHLAGARAPTLHAGSSASLDDGLLVDARGASETERATVAWDADVIRGRRGVASTTELDAAAKPWDRASGSASLRLSPVMIEAGVRAVTRRGGDLATVEASGPFAALRSSGAIGSRIAYDATVEGGGLRVSGSAASAAAREPPGITPDSVSYARAEIGALAAIPLGPIAATLSARGAGDVAAEGRRSGSDRAGAARLRLGLPLARAFEDRSAAPGLRNDPLVHVVEPFAEGAVLHAEGDALLGSAPGRGFGVLSGTAPLADAGVRSALGRWGRREAIELTLAAGASGPSDGSGAHLLARARLAGGLGWLGAQADAAEVAGPSFDRAGGAVVARVRLGEPDGVRLRANVAARDGVDPVLARALVDAPLEPAAGFLARRGTTGGAELVVPWIAALTTSLGADADVTTEQLVALRGGLELRDRCRCVTLRANGAHRIGREGVDVWIALDFATGR